MTVGRSFLLMLALLVPMVASAQASIFGVRGLGAQGRGASAASLGTAGSNVLVDPMSPFNPAALSMLTTVNTGLTSTSTWGSGTTPAGSGSIRQQRFPLAFVGGPVPRSSFGFGVSYSSYLIRDHAMVSHSVDSPRGVPIEVVDSIGAVGGVNDFRVAASFLAGSKLAIGAGVHLLTGSSRTYSRRVWADSTYQPTRQTAQVTHAGAAASFGILYNPNSRLHLAASARIDGDLQMERDSTRIRDMAMPGTFAVGARYRPVERLAVSGSAILRTWGDADDAIVAGGGIGARNTLDLGVGAELVRNVRRPDHKPLRLGVRYATLPFLLESGSQARELAVSVGTGLRFAGDFGGVDIALEHFRRSQGSRFSENGWQLTVGVSARGALGDNR